MLSNIINLNAEPAAREDLRTLTPKQEITVKLRNHYSQQTRLRRALRSHQVAYAKGVRQDIAIRNILSIKQRSF